MPSELVFPAAPQAARLTSSATPSYWYLDVDDALEISSICLVGAFHCSLVVRMLRDDGTIALNQFEHQATGPPDWTSTTHTPGRGTLLNATVYATDGAPRWGQYFVVVRIVRGAGVARRVLGTLIQSYITQRQDAAWPGSPIMASTQGSGCVRSAPLGIGALGVDHSYTVSSRTRWRLMAWRGLLTTDATVASRQPGIVITDTTNAEQWRSASPGSVGAGSAAVFMFAQGMPLANVISAVAIVGGILDGVTIAPGWHINTLTAGLQAGDRWTQITALVEEWVDGD